MTRRETNNFLQVFPPDTREWLKRLAQEQKTTPEVIVREIVRDVAEDAARAA